MCRHIDYLARDRSALLSLADSEQEAVEAFARLRNIDRVSKLLSLSHPAVKNRLGRAYEKLRDAGVMAEDENPGMTIVDLVCRAGLRGVPYGEWGEGSA